MFNYWATEVTDVWIGDEPQPFNRSEGKVTGVFDHASRARGAPLSPNSYKRLVNIAEGKVIKLNATEAPNNNIAQEFFQVDCGKASGLPTLKYRFGGSARVWTITPAAYVDELTPGTCVLNIRAIGPPDWLLGNFGETFLIGKYIVLDFETLRVRLSELPA